MLPPVATLSADRFQHIHRRDRDGTEKLPAQTRKSDADQSGWPAWVFGIVDRRHEAWTPFGEPRGEFEDQGGEPDDQPQQRMAPPAGGFSRWLASKSRAAPADRARVPALGRGGRLQLLEQLRQQEEIGHWFGSRNMQLRDNRADDSACLIVAAAVHEID
jgi:hypothetical protein